jgi:hypothetical protein
MTAGLLAKWASFSATTSARITRAAPPARAASAVMAPMVPAPITTAVSPGFMRALVAACRPMDKRFDDGPFGKADIVRQAIGEGCRMHHAAGEATVDGRRGPEAHRGIEVVQAAQRGRRIQARDARLHADAVADLELRDLGPDLDDGARGFVPSTMGASTLKGPMRPWV